MSNSTPSVAPAATSSRISSQISSQTSSVSLSLDALKAVADLLGGGEVVAYRPVFAHVFGGATAALLLSQFWFWTNTPTVKNRDGDGWFWKSQKEITQETGLTRYETDTARRKLVALGVLFEDLRGVPATQHYRLLWEHLQTQIAREKDSKTQFVENHQTGLLKTTKLVRGKPTNKLAGNPKTNTEITPETTSKKTQTRAKPILPAALSEKGSEKDAGQQAVYKAGAAKIKAALEQAASLEQAARKAAPASRRGKAPEGKEAPEGGTS